MHLSKYKALVIAFLLVISGIVLHTGIAHAQNPPGPPDGVYPAYNWNPGGSGWGYSVPEHFRYPPAVGWDPISNTYDGRNPTGDIEDLCNGVKKLLVPNMGAVFPSSPGYQSGPYSYTSFSSSTYVEYWVAAYQCWNSPADPGSAFLSGTGMEIDVNGSPATINLNTYDGANDPDRGGSGGNWHGWGGNISLTPGNNYVCMITWGQYNWTQGGGPHSEPYGPLGFGNGPSGVSSQCMNITYEQPPYGWIDGADCTIATGWVMDPDNLNSTLHVKIYRDALPEFGGTLVGEGDANVPRSDIGPFGPIGPHGFRIDISSAQDAFAHTFYAMAGKVDSRGQVDYFPLQGSARAGPCKLPKCEIPPDVTDALTGRNLIDSKGVITMEQGEAFNVTFGAQDLKNSNGQPISGAIGTYAIYALPNSPPRPPVLQGPVINYNSSNQYTVNNINNVSQSGAYAFQWTFQWPGGSIPTCAVNFQVITKPYFRVYGNDINAGAPTQCSFSDNLPPSTAPNNNDKATVLAWAAPKNPWFTQNPPVTESWGGAGVQFAVMALGEIDQFMSSSDHSPRTNEAGQPNQTHTTSILDLTFGNRNTNMTPPVNNGVIDNNKVVNYGGRAPHLAGCPTDWFGNEQKNNPSNIQTPVGGTMLISKATPVSDQTADYVHGDVVITKDIEYANSGGWKINQIPSYYLIVKGNIYVEPGVQTLDGVYIAQQDSKRPNTGRIYTCAYIGGDGKGALYQSATDLVNNCQKPLTINGAFIAQQVKLLRTCGTLRNSVENETPPATSDPNCTNDNIKSAEIFNFSPETYLANPDKSLQTGSTSGNYDSITSLPPIL